MQEEANSLIKLLKGWRQLTFTRMSSKYKHKEDGAAHSVVY